MKRGLSIILICLFVLGSPVHGSFIYEDDTTILVHTTAVDTSNERVYGEDLSQRIFNTVSLNSYRDFIKELTKNGSRPAGSPSNLGANNIAARNWIIKQMQEISNGRVEVEVLGDYASVLGRLPGYLPVDAPALMVGGHYDSVSVAPGANDDATGVAAALELLKVMSMYEWLYQAYLMC